MQLIAESLGFPVDAVTNETRLVVAAPDLAIGKGFAGTVAVGQTVTYTLTVSNTGDAASRGEVVVEDPMPPDISFGPPGGAGWSCVQDPSFEVSCRRSDSLAPGASWPPITISGTVLAVPPGGFVNTSTVDGGGDVNASNNSATAAPPNAPLASLALGKQVTPDTAAPGDEVIYLLTVKNAGGFGPATGVQLTDALPAGLELRSAEALDQGSCSGAVTCSLGSIPGGAVARVRIRAAVTGAATAGDVANTASVTSVEPDVHPEDNQATDTVTIRNTADLAVSKRRVGTPARAAPRAGSSTWSTTDPGRCRAGRWPTSCRLRSAVRRRPSPVARVPPPGGSWAASCRRWHPARARRSR